VLAADPHHAEVDVKEGLQDRPNKPQNQGIYTSVARARVKPSKIRIVMHRTLAYPFRRCPLQFCGT
jgi:hypothetical protein